jgi:hypothetical protein
VIGPGYGHSSESIEKPVKSVDVKDKAVSDKKKK